MIVDTAVDLRCQTPFRLRGCRRLRLSDFARSHSCVESSGQICSPVPQVSPESTKRESQSRRVERCPSGSFEYIADTPDRAAHRPLM
ncbi:(4Fe-4S)-binding protein [Micromonospora aurantiaca (nom. illeg.)]|uniref:(4Fe-4S)-binding protein n=1 Tax=Micromonospora aurantiaca (nom. illeg.) TaxID=47850 RepID=UPI0033F38291